MLTSFKKFASRTAAKTQRQKPMKYIDPTDPRIESVLYAMITTVTIYPMLPVGQTIDRSSGLECAAGPIFDSGGNRFERFFRPRPVGTEMRIAVWDKTREVWM